MRQLVYTMFISNNCASQHLWRKENLVKHQRVSKYYENDCRYFNWCKRYIKNISLWNTKFLPTARAQKCEDFFVNVQSFFSCCRNNDFFFFFLTKKYIYLQKLFQSKIFYANIVWWKDTATFICCRRSTMDYSTLNNKSF